MAFAAPESRLLAGGRAMMRLPDVVRRSAERYPDAPALAPVRGLASGWTYAQLRTHMERGAAFLQSLDLDPGDPVLLFAEAGAGWPVALFAILEAGLVAVPIPVETPLSTAIGVGRFAGVRAAVTGDRTREFASSSNLRNITVQQLLEGEAVSVGERSVPELAILTFTSGSTQQPRAVELTHSNLLANLEALLQIRHARPGDSFLSMLPPAHMFELMAGLLGPLACGARVVFASSLLPNRLLAKLREEQITHALSVPALLQVLYEEVVGELVDDGVLYPARREQRLAETASRLREMDALELARVRSGIRKRIGESFSSLVVGGSALDPIWAEIAPAVGLRLEIGYGLTEASPIVSVALASESPPGSAGKPLPGVGVRIAQDHEILVNGANVMRGYFRDPESTAAVLQDGWLHTGDHGHIDKDGFLFVTGRLKEALVPASGDTLYPEEVEPYYRSPRFAEHCVAGIADANGNDLPALFVVPAAETDDATLRGAFEELRAAAPPRLRVSRLVRLSAALPRTALGKVRRRLLGQEWQQRGTPL
jgi:long-chain acyl-CoA synthetase